MDKASLEMLNCDVRVESIDPETHFYFDLSLQKCDSGTDNTELWSGNTCCDQEIQSWSLGQH